MVMALDSIDHQSAKDEALRLAEKWVHTNYVAYKRYGAMFEKVRTISNYCAPDPISHMMLCTK
jgi:hypothetical protein